MVRCDKKSSVGRVTGGDPPEIIYLICECAGGVRCRPLRCTRRMSRGQTTLKRVGAAAGIGKWAGLDWGHRCDAMQGKREMRKGTWEVLGLKYRLTCGYVFIRGR